MSETTPSLEEYVGLFAAHGVGGLDYLRRHFPRFIATRQRLLSHCDQRKDIRILDVGAHWLHQTLLYAIEGFAVTAMDLPATLELEGVQALARTHSITLLPNSDLEHPLALAAVADDTFDIVLFTEVLEHLAFNPVAMWREIHRVMKPGARIVVTTPNYYALRSRIRHWWRAIRGFGGGVDVDQVLAMHTLGHHWKEYSRRELLRYFTLLSPGFACRNFAHVGPYPQAASQGPARELLRWLERALPPLRQDLYLEVELARKDKGIVVAPHW